MAKATEMTATNASEPVLKFKPTQALVLVTPSKDLANLNNLKQSVDLLRILIALNLSKCPFDLALPSDYEVEGLKKLPVPLLHHRPTDLCLFESVSIVKYLLASKGNVIESSNTLENVLKTLLKHYEFHGQLDKNDEKAVELVNELNKNFSMVKKL